MVPRFYKKKKKLLVRTQSLQTFLLNLKNKKMSFNITTEIASFGGNLLKLTHFSSTLGCEMSLNLYLPNTNNTTTTITTSTTKFENDKQIKFPVLFFLSGLTCTGDNCAEKGFLQYAASQKRIAIIYPDTSPRGLNIPGEDDSYDFGTGASFYLDATQSPWSTNYNMETYITVELPKELFAYFPQLDSSRISITGHSMGGHGALMLFLKNPGMYQSVSAFAPICNPIKCSWGQKAFSGYLGVEAENSEKWKMNDATELVQKWSGGSFRCLIDVGTNDQFYKQKQLLPENLAEAARKTGMDQDLVIRYQEGYDHSYYFVSSFASDHVNHAAKFFFA
ncbi:putative s-formylglutathione hydrolase [Erysiphe necator]|uniref:S-formylglutathione hydrolase n=1 Tax=Uncinula necator TaxID=52586 RepID=A0A0B1P3N6_UNCNE|nr:putative s-formylglutathione hydrolase [Erysiphe necator]